MDPGNSIISLATRAIYFSSTELSGFPILLSFKFDFDISSKISLFKALFQRKKYTLFSVVGNKEIILLMCFKDREEYENELSRLKESLSKNNLSYNQQSIPFHLQKHNFLFKMDMASLTKKLVFPESF